MIYRVKYTFYIYGGYHGESFKDFKTLEKAELFKNSILNKTVYSNFIENGYITGYLETVGVIPEKEIKLNV